MCSRKDFSPLKKSYSFIAIFRSLFFFHVHFLCLYVYATVSVCVCVCVCLCDYTFIISLKSFVYMTYKRTSLYLYVSTTHSIQLFFTFVSNLNTLKYAAIN